MARKFIEEFDIQIENPIDLYVSDYEAFPNKVLLDELRTKIIQNLIDNNITKARDMNDFVKKQIDKTIEGYDLSNVERSYIYNLIDNEVNGNGPLTELLEDKEEYAKMSKASNPYGDGKASIRIADAIVQRYTK